MEHYKNVNENPCNMCMPMGGIIPFKGLEESMVLLHGSQGCAGQVRHVSCTGEIAPGTVFKDPCGV